MKHVRKVLPLVLLLVAFSGCDFIEQLQKGVSHSASRINSIQAVGGTKEFAFVDIEYVFTGVAISDEQAVFTRQGSGDSTTMDITVAGTFYTDVDTLQADETYTYELLLKKGSKISDYDEIEVQTLPIINISYPEDTFETTESSLEVTWDKMTYDGEDYLTYEVALYDAEGIDLTDPDLEALLALTEPINGPTEVTLSSSDSQGSINFDVNNPYFIHGYIVSVSTKKALFDKLSNKSTAFKPFLWIGEPPQ